MSHVLFNVPLRNGIDFFCECGRFLGHVSRPFTPRDQSYIQDILLAHRQHALISFGVPTVWRIGSTRSLAVFDEDPPTMNADLAKIIEEMFPVR